MKGPYQPIRNKIKMTVKDLTAFLDEDVNVIIRDVSPDQTEDPGPDDDGIIFTGTSKHLRFNYSDICVMRVTHITPQLDEDHGYSLYITAVQSKITFKCNSCNSKFITIADGHMITHMCPKCGCEMEPEDE